MELFTNLLAEILMNLGLSYQTLSFYYKAFPVTATAQKMQFSIKGFFSKCDQIRSTADLVTFTEEIVNGKLHFLCSEPLPDTNS